MKRTQGQSFGMKGKKHSEITKLRMSKARIGMKMDKEWCENIGKSLLGIKRSDETRKKISLAKQGNKSWNWKGGISKPILFKRFDWTCAICKLKDPEIMEIDHIKPKRKYPKLKSIVKNLQVLCPNCHRRKSNKENKIYKRK